MAQGRARFIRLGRSITLAFAAFSAKSLSSARSINGPLCLDGKFETAAWGVSTGGNHFHDDFALTPNATQLLVTSPSTSGNSSYILTNFDIDPTSGHLSISYKTEKWGHSASGQRPARVVVSHDGRHAYILYLEDKIIETYSLVEQSWMAIYQVGFTANSLTSTVYLGISSGDTTLIILKSTGFQRFSRDAITGELSALDESYISNGFIGGASVSSGDYLVVIWVTHIQVFFIGNGNSGGVTRPQDFPILRKPIDVVVAPDYSTVYVATGDGDILWFAMSFVSGVPTVETSSTGTVSSKGVSYLAIHPHGTDVYAVNSTTGTIVSYFRSETTGNLVLDCHSGEDGAWIHGPIITSPVEDLFFASAAVYASAVVDPSNSSEDMAMNVYGFDVSQTIAAPTPHSTLNSPAPVDATISPTPSIMPKAVAVLTAPQIVGLCGEVVLDGRASSGGFLQALSAAWTVSAAESVDSYAFGLTSKNLAEFNGSLVATLNATELEVGITYTFTLTVHNSFGSQDEASASIIRRNEDLPTVLVLGPSTKSVLRSRSTRLRMVATPPACDPSSSLTYTWTEEGRVGYQELGFDAFEGLASNDPTTIVLPANTLGYPGSAYLFRGFANIRGSLLNSSVLAEVVVRQGALRASINGGSYHQHTAGRDLVLDGSSSVDEDDISALPLRYDWSCLQNCSSISDENSSSNGSLFTFPSANMESGLVCAFSLNISKGTIDSSDVFGLYRSDVATVTVEVISYEAPEVVVVPKDTAAKGDPTRKLVVYGGVVGGNSSNDLMWTQTEGDLALGSQDWNVFFSSAQNGPNLVVRPGMLSGGSTYTFRLSAVDMESKATGFSEVKILMNSPPYGGHIGASPKAGVAAFDTFLLESLEWSDDVDDLPLMFSFSFAYGEGQTTPLYGLSMYPVELPEWRGPLPIGQHAGNFTISIAGHVSDTFGAETTWYNDANESAVAVRVVGWEKPSADIDFATSVSNALVEAIEEAKDQPGKITSAVRAYASVVLEAVTNTSEIPAAERGDLKNLIVDMIDSVAADFESLDYATKTARAVLDTLVLISSENETLGIDSQEALFATLENIVTDVVQAGSWHSGIQKPIMQVLDQAVGVYGTSGGAVPAENIGANSSERLFTIVQALLLLMEASLEDGEEVMNASSVYIDISCVVSSAIGGLTLSAGSSSVSFAEDVAELPLNRRKMTTQGDSQHERSARRLLENVEASPTSALAITSAQFNVNERVSEFVEGGVTTISLKSTSSNDDIPLASPVTIHMRSSVASGNHVPSCSFYDEDTGVWKSDGLVVESVSAKGAGGGEGLGSEVNISCISYHLSDFAVSTTQPESVFAPVKLSTGLEVLAKARKISIAGAVVVLASLVLFVISWAAARTAGAWLHLEVAFEKKLVRQYIKTGQASMRPVFNKTISFADNAKGNALLKKNLGGRRKRTIWKYIALRVVIWYNIIVVLTNQVVQHHPWVGIVAPMTTRLSLQPAQLLLLVLTQIMVQMMVEAAFSGHSTSNKIETVRIIIGLAATIPASIILPFFFEAASAPPRSITTEVDWLLLVAGSRGNKAQGKGRTGSETDLQEEGMAFNKEDGALTVKSSFASQVQGHKLPYALILLLNFPGLRKSSDRAGAREASSTKIGKKQARGIGIVRVGLAHLVLDIVCMALTMAIDRDQTEHQVLFSITLGNLVLGLITLDAVLAARTSLFSLLNATIVFKLVFARICLSLLQAILAYHGSRESSTQAAFLLYIFLVAFSSVKMGMSYAGEAFPCMDAINEDALFQLWLAKKYRRNRKSVTGRRSTVLFMKNSSASASLDSSAWNMASVEIQSLVRGSQARTRMVRRMEVLHWRHDDVRQIRRKITERAYVWLCFYLGTVIWINLCYVSTYDPRTIRSWVMATAATIVVDIVIRKPLTVIAKASIYALREQVRSPHERSTGNGRVHGHSLW